MKRLYLMRHAKSSWETPDQDDIDRPLAPRGRRAAPLMGSHMRNLGYAPSIALCSPARRARETWSCLADALGGETAEEVRPELYDSDPRAVLDLVKSLDDAHSSAIVVSHNPTIHTLALGLIGYGANTADPFGKYPTAALAVLDFDVAAWRDIAPGQAHLVGFTCPKDLDSAA
jgi:phosphohistidine phosphatase